jgi:hypothetical protein
MTWLKKVGLGILKATALVAGIGPMVVSEEHEGKLVAVLDKLTQIRQVVLHAEAMGTVLGLTGEDKLRAAGPVVADIILSSALVGDRKIDDEALFKRGGTKIADGVADVLNSLKDDVDVENHD